MSKKRSGKAGIKKKISPNLNMVTSLNVIASKRTGGAQNIRGMEFQLFYSCFLILKHLTDETEEIRLEGIEDIDYLLKTDGIGYIQLKTSVNVINSSSLWEMNVLQNFLEVYKIDPTSKFKFIHNTSFANGKLKALIDKDFSADKIEFWKQKFLASNIDISGINIRDFFESIEFEKIAIADLKKDCIILLFERFKINSSTETQYLNSLFSSIFEWAKERKIIKKRNLDDLILSVTESFSKHPNNPAIQNNWITSITFEESNSSDSSDYFDGKAAKPIHIANNLPVERQSLENEIEKTIGTYDITLVRASSGQGKSTLAWMVCKKLLKKGYTIFELHQCSEFDQASHLFDFILSRIKIGQLPLIVIDGLDARIKDWGMLAEKLKDMAVKFIVTSREEDWIRYNYDVSRLKLKPVEIKLTFQEAQNIFSQLKAKGKLHSSITDWQPIWEKVAKNGLLIEYVYLLTQGKMIAERLQEQIRRLNNEKSAAAKIEILRLVSLADLMNLKLQTTKITAHINSNIKFDSDRNEVYRQLENEYFLNFSKIYVEGLHPVRSKHLVELLHSSIMFSETILSLFEIVEDDYMYDFFISIPLFIEKTEKDIVLNKIAEILSTKKYSEIVFALDGLMQVEAKKFWIDNRKVFDDVAKTSAIEVFIFDTLPYTKLNFLSTLSNQTQGTHNFDNLTAKLKELTSFSTKDSYLTKIVELLRTKIKTRSSDELYEGLGFLVKWFKRLNIDFPSIISVDNKLLLETIKMKNIDEAGELYSYHYITNPENYSAFVREYKEEIISWLKKKTNSITIVENLDEIHISYLLDDNDEKLNELSVYRINTIYNFLPFYKKYCTELMVFPFPDMELYKASIINASKKMPKENVADLFDGHINQIWADAILSNYRLGSMYQWQKEYFNLRIKIIEFAKIAIKFFDSVIENNENKIKQKINPLVEIIKDLSNLLSLPRKPPKSERYYEKDTFDKELKQINSWVSSVFNFVNQIHSIVAPKEEIDRHVAISNLRDVAFNFIKMQNAFKTIIGQTFDYFPSKNIEENESTCYHRLLKTILFYRHRIEIMDLSKVTVARKAVEDWYVTDRAMRLKKVSNIVKSYAGESEFQFHLPVEITEDASIKYCVIGLEMLDFSDPKFEDTYKLMIGLIDLDTTDITFFTFVFITNQEAFGAYQVSKSFFERLRSALQNDQVEDPGYGNPIPIFLTKEIISVLPGVKLKSSANNERETALFKIICDVNKLNEYRKLLLKNNIEENWLSELEIKYNDAITSQLIALRKRLPSSESLELEEIINAFLMKNITLTQEDLVAILNKKFQDFRIMTN